MKKKPSGLPGLLFLLGFLLLILLSLYVMAFGAAPALAGYEDLFKKVRQASWAIYVREAGGIRAICSAAAYQSNDTHTYLLTAGHCIIGNDFKKTDLMVTQDHRTFAPAKLFKSGLEARKNTKDNSSDLDDYHGNDWAILKADVGHEPTMPVGKSDDLTIGEDLVMVGMPFGLDFLAVQGVVGSKDVSLSTMVWNHYFGANIFSAGGNSGSAVISTKQRAIVGVVDAGPGGQSSMMIFMPIHLIPVDTWTSK